MKRLAIWAVLFRTISSIAYCQCETGFSDPVAVQSPIVRTVGGITYLSFGYSWTCPQQLWKMAPILQGTNIEQPVYLVSVPGWCTQEFPPIVYSNYATLVMGKLGPGEYMLRISTTLPFGGPRQVIARVPFTVGEAAATLVPVAANSTDVMLQVHGVPDVSYRVEYSSTMTNWTVLRTQIGGPFPLADRPGTNRFYRLNIADNVPVCLN